MKRVVIVKMWALGDIVIATPMIDALRKRYPSVKITWVVDQFHGDIMKGHPGVDDLECIDSGRWRRLLRKGNIPGWIAETIRLRNQIASYNPDAAINCHPDKWWTIFLCPAPVRVGLYPSLTLPGSARFYTHALNRPAGMHNTFHYLTATEALDCENADLQMTIGETPEERPFLQKFAAEHGLNDDTPQVLIVPISTAENKNWEPERFAALADWLYERFGAQVIVSTSPRDREKAAAITDRVKHPVILSAGTTMREYMALIRRADLVICVDTSALHLAAAMQRPYIALFGPTPIKELFPLVSQGLPVINVADLSCAPCNKNQCSHPVFRACMKAISLEAVQQAVIEKLTVRRDKLA